VIGDVEKLSPELDVERFRDALDREILENREIADSDEGDRGSGLMVISVPGSV